MKRMLLVEKKPTKLLSKSKVARRDLFLQAKHEKKIKKKKKMKMKRIMVVGKNQSNFFQCRVTQQVFFLQKKHE